MIEVLRHQDQNAMYMDPAHPTPAGHKIIADELYKIIRQLPVYNEACQVPGVSVANSSAPSATAASVAAH
jgi:phospholipase/lecithinase/hemolysin